MSSAEYKKSLDINTNQAKVVENYTSALISLDYTEKAERLLKSAEKLWPKNKNIKFLRGALCYKTKDIVSLEKIIKEISNKFFEKRQREVIKLWEEDK